MAPSGAANAYAGEADREAIRNLHQAINTASTAIGQMFSPKTAGTRLTNFKKRL